VKGRSPAWLLALALLAVGCAQRSAGVPHYSHVLRFADVSDPDRLNPYLSTMDLTYDLSSLIFSYLVIADADGSLQGDLATGVPTLRNGGISADGKTYVYRLHRGVRWQDGAPFTSADVKFSWQAVVNPYNNTLHREGYDEIARIDTPDPYTVVVHLKRRYPPFVSKFFAPLQEGGKGILPRHLLARYRSINTIPFNGAPVGTGPFKFVRWDRGRRIMLERNGRYFRGRPKLARIEFLVIPDDQTMLNELRLHDIDLITSPPSTLYEQYRAVQGVRVQLSPWNAQELFIMNQSKPGLNDPIVRRAITMSLDYDGLIRKLTHGVAQRALDVIPPTAIGYVRNPAYRYDPVGSNALLQRAGWVRGPDGVRNKNGVRLEYTLDVIAGSDNQRKLSVQLQQYLAAIGLRLTIKSFSYNTIFTPDGPIYGNRYGFAVYSQTMPWDPDNLYYLGCAFFYPKGENVYRYCSRAVDRLEEAGLQTDDPAARARIYHQAERLIWRTVPYVPLCELRRLSVSSQSLQNFTVNPGSTPWYNAWQWDI